MDINIKTGAWYYDQSISISFPDSWDVATYWPDTPPPLTDEKILSIINTPVGQPPLSEVARGKRNPVLIIDDLARPTPIFRILPFVLDQFRKSGVNPRAIRILVATGTHGPQDESALARKIGEAGSDTREVVVHDDRSGTKYVGKTSFGTPIYVDKEVINSDLVVGISGVYPHHLAGYSGGSKLALGVLGRKSIAYLHNFRRGCDKSHNIDNDFKKDLNEIARAIGLNTMYSLHINESMELVNIHCGDHFQYFTSAAKFTAQKYWAPYPTDADAVIVNAYPFDVSFSTMRKALGPLNRAQIKATKVIIASNLGGMGVHRLNPVAPTKWEQYRKFFEKLYLMDFDEFLKRVSCRILGWHRKTGEKKDYQLNNESNRGVWIYRPKNSITSASGIDGFHITNQWDHIIDTIQKEQCHQGKIKVRIYPCGGLHFLA